MLDFGPVSTDFLPQQIHPQYPLPPIQREGGREEQELQRHILILTKKYIKNAYGIKPREKGV